MKFINPDSYPQIFICTSIALMFGVMVVNTFRRKKDVDKAVEGDNKKKDKSKKAKSKPVFEVNQRLKFDNFLSDNENFLYYSEEEDVMPNQSILKKSKMVSKNPKPFLSENEEKLKSSKKGTKKKNTANDKLDDFYFVLHDRLKKN